MRPTPGTLKIPSKLIDELGGYGLPARRPRGRRDLIPRKDRRREERAQKKADSYKNGLPQSKKRKLCHEKVSNDESRVARSAESPIALKDGLPPAESGLKTPTQLDKPDQTAKGHISSSSPQDRLSRALAAKLAEDDAEIATLERKLGIKSKKRLPKSFKDEGLDELLNGLYEGSDATIRDIEGKHANDKAWLAQKRQKKKGFYNREIKKFSSGDESAALGELHERGNVPHNEQDGSRDLDEGNTFSDLDDEFIGFDTDQDDASPAAHGRTPRKENPYVPPKLQDNSKEAKYTPPSLRKPTSSESETLVHLRRQTQGLVNRLTEANLITILSGVENLYREHARQNVTSTLVDILLTSVCEPTSLPDTLIILPAGFIAAVYKVVGTDFGADLIQQIVELFDRHYATVINSSTTAPVAATLENSKETANLVSLLAELYNFQVIGSNLIFDYIRRFLSSLSPLNAELLLRIIRISGPQLRQDDPSSLKDIVNIIRLTVASIGEENISVRTKFLIETINDLKNNRMKTGVAASALTSEHTIRMKKILGTLNSRSLKASEPLRIGLKDIYDSDKKGKWWLVGASWAGSDALSKENVDPVLVDVQEATDRSFSRDNDSGADLVRLAREQRMNTDIRRAIFITIMSASDYQDAYLRLTKLKLRKVQELEIPKVLIHCSGAENSYNPYYTLIGQKLCGDRRLKMAFQFGLWDIFRRLGEDKENDKGDLNMVEEENDGDFLEPQQLVNLAKMFGALIVAGSMQLSVLKNLNLSTLQPRTQIFVEVLCITVLLQLQKHSQKERDEESIAKAFTSLKDAPQMMISLQYFLKRVVAKTDIAGGVADKAKVKKGCKVAISVLESLLAAIPEGI